jgi:ABC-type transport system substrate-binding protein
MRTRAVWMLAAVALMAGACSDDDDGAAETTTPGTEAVEATDADASTTAPADSAGADTTVESTEGTGSGAADTTVDTAADEPDEPFDPEGVARIALDLESASTGGFKWDPVTSTSQQNPQIGVYLWVYGSLMRLDGDGQLVPELAEEVDLVDTTTITIVMRDGVTTSDGKPLDAAMMKSILEANLAKKNPDGTNPTAFRTGFYSLQTVTLTDDKTLTLSIPDGTAATWYDTYLYGPETLPVFPDTNFDAPTGAGPFAVTDYVPSERLVLEKNPTYWDAENIKLNGIEVINVPASNATAAVNALNADQADWARIEFASIDGVQGAEVIIEADPDAYTRVVICKSSAPLDDERVRQALNHATDRDAIVQAMFGGQTPVAWDLWPEDNPLHNPENTERYPHDPGKAADLLAQAGAQDLTVDIIPLPAQGIDVIAQILQQQWGAAGITLNLVPTTSIVQDLLTDVKAPLGILPRGGASRTRLDGFSGTGIVNFCKYADPELDAMINELRSYSDTSDEGIQLWHDIQEKISVEALDVPLLFQPGVHGLDEDRLGGYSLVRVPAYPVPDMWELYVKA